MTSPIPLPTPARVIGGARDLFNHPTTVVEGLLPGAEGIQAGLDAVISVRRWLGDRHNWIRVGWTVSGVVLIFAGAVLLSKPAVSAVVGAVPAGKAVKIVKKVAS